MQDNDYVALADANVSSNKAVAATSSLPGTVANIAKCMLGSAILTLSWSFYFSSLVPGVVCSVLMCGLSAYTFYLLGLCSEATGKQCYADIWEHLFGPRWVWLVDTVTLMYCLMTFTGYLIVIGDYLPKGLAGIGISWEPLQQRQVAILVVSAVVMPLNLLRDLSLLGYTSLIGTMGCLYTMAVLSAEAVKLGASDYDALVVQPGIFVMLSAVAFAFNGHFNAPELYHQLEGRSRRRWLTATVIGFTLGFIVSTTCAVAGYVLLGSSLSTSGHSNVLTAVALKGKKEIMVAYLGQTLSVTFSIPFYVQGVRNVLERIWVRDLRRFLPPWAQASGSLADMGRDAPLGRRVCLTLIPIALALAVAMGVTDLGIMCSLNGAVCSCLLMFIFPPLMYLRCETLRVQKSYLERATGVVVAANDNNDQSSTDTAQDRCWPRISIAVGIFACVTGLAATIMLAVGEQSDLRW